MLVWLFVEGLSQRADVAGQVVLLHHGVGPNLLQQFILLQHLSAILDQRQQNLEGFKVEWHNLPVARQDVFDRVHAKRAKLIEWRGLLSLRSVHNFSEVFRITYNFSEVIRQPQRLCIQLPSIYSQPKPANAFEQLCGAEYVRAARTGAPPAFG